MSTTIRGLCCAAGQAERGRFRVFGHSGIELIFNKLIDRIEVGNLEIMDGIKTQEILWRFAGEM